MNLTWLQGLIYGLISGLAEFLPISSQAHQNLLLQIFGANSRDPVLDMLTHGAMLLSILTGYSTILGQIKRDHRLQQRSRVARGQTSRIQYDVRLVKNAAFAMIISLVILSYIRGANNSFISSAIFLMVNGIILYIPSRMLQGNKDARGMSLLDSLLIGITAAFSSFCGISRIGTAHACAISRGADRQHSLNWAILLSIPALAMWIVFDFIQIFSHSGISFWSSIPAYLFSSVGAYCGGYCSLLMVRSISAKNGLSGFSYYSWGLALLTFILYLIVA